MKHRLIPILLVLCLLTGCTSQLIPNEYTVVTEHSDTAVEEETDALTAENYEELKYAILSFVESGVTHGVIRSYRYDGDVTEDISSAAYDVWRNDPMGAYAVEFITTDSNLLLAYYEIHVDITYREDVMDAQEIQYVRGAPAAEAAILDALSRLKSRVTLRVSAYGSMQDCEKIVQDYCAANPETMMETPRVEYAVYPDRGTVRILDVRFHYRYSPMETAIQQSSVNTALNSAVNYVRYRKEERAKAESLVSFLLGRFEYTEGTSVTPFYSLLCEGVANSENFAKLFQLLCDRVGLTCRTVYGNLDGESYHWNILQLEDRHYHIDLMRYVREGLTDLVLYTDADMEGYSWNRDEYPACISPEQEAEAENPENPEEPENPDEPGAAETPEDGTAGEDTPPAEEEPKAQGGEPEPGSETETP